MIFNYKIYALMEIESGDIRYIGQTRKTLQERLKGHLRDTQKTHKTNWIKKNKTNINIILLEENIKTKEEICAKEVYYISEYKREGYRLVNTTNGGEGWFGTEFTEEHKSNISKNHADVSGAKNPMYGKTHTKETMRQIKDKIKIWNESGGYSETQLANLRESMTGNKNPNSKLNEQIVLEIRNRFISENISYVQLSIEYGVNPPAIYKIIKKISWKHI